jgi:transposase-like protein
MIEAAVTRSTTAHTDCWRGYAKLERSGYRHLILVIDAADADAAPLLPRVHLVFSLVKRWLLGTHQGAVSIKHLPAYIEEYPFRFNRRTAKAITHRFQRVIERAVTAPPHRYWQIVGRLARNQLLRAT